jgi:FixJ family two-component response regulator
MAVNDPAVYVVDDDESVRRAIARLIRSAGIDVRVFASGEEFLEAAPPVEKACLVLDVRMPGMSGLELHQKLREQGLDIPVIFVTAYDSEEVRTQARIGGASACFRKPVDDSALLDAIAWAVSGRGK